MINTNIDKPKLDKYTPTIKTHAMGGFTLAELLISLAILGVIATFTIPKVLNSSQSEEWNSGAKESAAMLTQAYQLKKLNGGVDANTGVKDLTPFMNYVSIDSSSTIDAQYTQNSIDCSAGADTCLKMHNGAIIRFNNLRAFGGTDVTNAVGIIYDPDGTYSGSPTGVGKGVNFWIYYNGLIRDRGNIYPNTISSAGPPVNPEPTFVPPWFSW